MEKVSNVVKKAAPQFITTMGVLVASYAVGTFAGAEYGVMAAHLLTLSLNDKISGYLSRRIK